MPPIRRRDDPLSVFSLTVILEKLKVFKLIFILLFVKMELNLKKTSRLGNVYSFMKSTYITI